MKDTDDAISRINEIHAQLAKSGIFKGYRSIYVSVSGLIAFIATLFYPGFVKDPDTRGFVYYWVTIAFINLFIAAGMILYQYIRTPSGFERQKIRTVAAQFLTIVAAGAIVTIPLTFSDPVFIPLLPGIWAILFGIGIVSMRPYLPRLTILAVIFYFIAGALLFYISQAHLDSLPIAMGVSFGAGQFIAALILYWSIERREDERAA